jgi:hypothetical protein
MERLHQMIGRVGLMLLLFASSSLGADDYCSLVVRVLDPKGRRPETIVSVHERNGRMIETEPTNKDATFCDLGLTSVTVKVGADGTCNQVIVNNVRLYWRETSHLTVTYDWELCDQEPVPSATCIILFRISDVNGKWLERSSINFAEPRIPAKQTDSAGRARTVVGAGQRASGTVTAAGYVTKTFSSSCSRSEPLREELIKLERSPGG